jgi:hypothetical protein
MPEKFDPGKFKTFKELPENQKPQFKKVEGGFAREETLSEEEATMEEARPDNFDSDSESGVKKKIVEIPGIGEIEYQEKTVMFPEKIVQETGGVKGYIRKIVLKENLNEFLSTDKRIEKDGKEIEDTKSKYFFLLEKLWEALTNGNFPDKTFNHIFYAAWGGSVEDREHDREAFFRNRIILQKIFNIETPKEKGGASDNNSMNYLFPFTKKGNKPTEIYRPFRNNEEELREIILNKKIQKEYYFLSRPGSGGLSVGFQGNLWNGWHSESHKQIIFGFGLKNKVFQEYLENISRFYSSETIKEGLKAYSKDDIDERIEHTKYSISKLMGRKFQGSRPWSGSSEDHPRIPMVINYPGITRLRWCHADYASIPTKKGLNILETIT